MRVVIATGRIGALGPAAAGAAVAQAFVAVPGRRAEVAVVPLAAGGEDLGEALSAVGWQGVVVPASETAESEGLDVHTSTVGTGTVLAAAVASGERRIVVDLTRATAVDAGAGILAGLGAAADVPLDQGLSGLTGLSRVDLAAARAAVEGVELVAVVTPREQEQLLLGMRGVASARAFASGLHVPAARDAAAAIAARASAVGGEDAPGLGAGGGAALAIVALGGRVLSGVDLCAQVAGLPRTLRVADVALTATDSIDFVSRGGDVVAAVSELAAEAMVPCVVVAREVHVSARELRTFGVESAHAVGGDADLASGELTRRCASVAASWTW